MLTHAFVTTGDGHFISSHFKQKLINCDLQKITLTRTDEEYAAREHEYKALAQADILIVANKNTPIAHDALRHLLYAMSLNKPIILLQPPVYAKNTDRFLKHTVESRLSKLVICDLDMLDDEDARVMLHNAASIPANYVLTKHQVTLIRAKLRAYFRNLL